jgi:hypothetical protein
MIGHCISFAQRGPESFLTLLPSIDNDLFNRIVVTFMGRRNMPEDVATFLRHVPTANVRPELVIMHLRVLKAINPYWDSIQINDSLDNREAMHAVPGQIFGSRTVIDDPTIMALDQIAYDNPAQAVDTSNIQPLPVVLDTQHTNTVSFDHVFLNPRDGDESIAIAGPLSCQQRMVEAIRDLGHGMEGETTEEQVQEHPLMNPPLDTNRHLVFDLEDDNNEHDLTYIDAGSIIDPWCRHCRLSSHQEIPPYVPRLLPLPGVQELPRDPPLDVINQQDPLDFTDDNNLPPLWDPMSVDSVDYYDNEITDLPPLLDDDDDDDDYDI